MGKYTPQKRFFVCLFLVYRYDYAFYPFSGLLQVSRHVGMQGICNDATIEKNQLISRLPIYKWTRGCASTLFSAKSYSSILLQQYYY